MLSAHCTPAATSACHVYVSFRLCASIPSPACPRKAREVKRSAGQLIPKHFKPKPNTWLPSAVQRDRRKLLAGVPSSLGYRFGGGGIGGGGAKRSGSGGGGGGGGGGAGTVAEWRSMGSSGSGGGGNGGGGNGGVTSSAASREARKEAFLAEHTERVEAAKHRSEHR